VWETPNKKTNTKSFPNDACQIGGMKTSQIKTTQITKKKMAHHPHSPQPSSPPSSPSLCYLLPSLLPRCLQLLCPCIIHPHRRGEVRPLAHITDESEQLLEDGCDLRVDVVGDCLCHLPYHCLNDISLPFHF